MKQIAIIAPEKTTIIENTIQQLETLGYKALYSKTTICDNNTINILKPKYRPTRGSADCKIINWIPHIQLIPELAKEGMLESSNEKEFIQYLLIRLKSIEQKRQPYGKINISIRPPPFTIISELYYEGREKTIKKAERFISQGTDVLSIGIKPDQLISKSNLIETLKTLSRIAPTCIDTVDLEIITQALSNGAACILSLTSNMLDKIPEKYRDSTSFVIIPTSSKDPAKDLLYAVNKARKLGYEYPIIDPIMYPPINPGSMTALINTWNLSKQTNVPILIGLHNFYELIDADSPGVIATLVSLLGESGVSLLLVGEESVKTRGAVIETRLAVSLVELAMYYRTPPKDYPIKLLFSKYKHEYF